MWETINFWILNENSLAYKTLNYIKMTHLNSTAHRNVTHRNVTIYKNCGVNYTVIEMYSVVFILYRIISLVLICHLSWSAVMKQLQTLGYFGNWKERKSTVNKMIPQYLKVKRLKCTVLSRQPLITVLEISSPTFYNIIQGFSCAITGTGELLKFTVIIKSINSYLRILEETIAPRIRAIIWKTLFPSYQS